MELDLVGHGASSTRLPPSALFYAFSDPPDAALLLAVAAWALADDDTIDLAPLTHPRPVDGRLSYNRKRGYAERPGLEGQLLKAMTQRLETRGVSVAALLTIGIPVGFETEARHDSLRHAIETGPWRTRNPPKAVLRLCKREARRAGGSEFEFHEVESRWRTFGVSHPELHAALLDDCRAGLRQRGGL